MGKFLIALIWLFGQAPLLADFNEQPFYDLGLVGEIAPSRTNDQAVANDLQVDCFARIDCESFVSEVDLLSIALDNRVESGAGPHIFDRETNKAGLVVSYRDVQDRHEAVGHHRDATAGCTGRNCRENNTNGSKHNPEGTDEPNDVIQPVTIGSNSIPETHRGSVGPLGAEIRSFDGLWLLIAISAATLGTLLGVLFLGYQRPFFTRWWYIDALLCEIVGCLGLVALPSLI